MKSHHPSWLELAGVELAVLDQPRTPAVLPGWQARLGARLFAARYDRQVDERLNPAAGTALAVHHQRLKEPRQREQLACVLRLVLEDAAEGSAAVNPRVPVQVAAVRHASEVIELVIQRLAEPRSARVRGMARLRLLLADGRGPLYRSGPGSLNAAIRGVLAAL